MLETSLCGVTMKSPVIAASGTFGFGLEYADYVDLNRVGAISVKGLSLQPRRGNDGRRICETPSGMLNCIGLENPGVQVFVQDILPQLQQYDVPVMANISGASVGEYGEMAAILDRDGVDFLEVNISCPNVQNGCLAFGVDCASAAAVTDIVKKNTTKPVIVKLTPNVTDITEVAKAVEAAGADGISLINTLLGMAIDVDTWKPLMGNRFGGLSGPAVKPVAVRMVYQVAQAVSIPIVGMGGIMTGRDAAEFMLAGATAVSVGTATLADPRAIAHITTELEAYGRDKGLQHISDIVGKCQ
jgi:dihydroorotate dehydrogenase (NAD+) catalytic subunit